MHALIQAKQKWKVRPESLRKKPTQNDDKTNIEIASAVKMKCAAHAKCADKIEMRFSCARAW